MPEVEAPNRSIAYCQSGVVGFHAALTELASVCGMADEGCDTSAAVYKAGVWLRVTLRQRAGIQPRLLEANFLQPFPRAQVLSIGSAVIAFVHPGRCQDACAKKPLMCFDHRADGSFVFHPDRRTRIDEEEIASHTTELKGTPKRSPLGGLALVEAAHSLGVQG